MAEAPQYVEDFFQHCFGFDERSLQYPDVQGRFELEEDGQVLVAREVGRRFRAGQFRSPSLGELRAEALAAVQDARGGGGEPVVVRHVATLDAMRDHAAPENAGALFQVASQFNCLEFTSMKRVPEDGVKGYAHDRTQGPSCAIACAPATVYRNYFLPLAREGSEEPQVGQSAALQLECLEAVAEVLGNGAEKRFFFVENGYVCSDSEQLALLKEQLHALGEEGLGRLRDALKVGLAFDSEVVFKAFVPFEGLLPATDFQTVSQVFCAAAKVNTSFAKPQEWEPFARLLLEATYEASLWAGVVNMCRARRLAREEGREPPAGCHRVLLALVGGGVFGNELQWIVDAVNRALTLVAAAAPEGGWGLEACLLHFKSVNPALAEAVRLGAPEGAWGLEKEP